MIDSIDKACGDTQLGEWQSICGTAYRLVCVNENAESQDKELSPFSMPVLDPKYTAVIYSSEVENKPILAFTYCDILDDNGNAVGRKYTVYDKTYQYIFETKGVNTQIKSEDLVKGYPKPHMLGIVPIIEYPNNQWRLGDFETVLTILDGLNKLQSDRINSVEQLVNSILVFVNCELKDEIQNPDKKSDLEKLKEQLAISITSNSGQPADIKFVNSQVNQNEAETLAQTLIDYVYAVTGIPDRKTRSNGGGDTGDAVYLRDGWASLEVVARIKERYFRKSEKQMLRIVCKILETFRNIKLKLMHIEPTFVRNRTNNLLNKAQAMSVLKELQFIDPIDIVTLGGISDNPIDLVKRGLSYYEKQEGKNAEENWEIYKNVHEPIIERSVWETIQKTFGNTKSRKPKNAPKNMFAGFLECSDCGAKLNYKFTNDNPDNHYFSCKNKRANNGLCKTTHHIRVDTLTHIVRNNIAEIVRFANDFEDEFVKLVVDENYKLTQERQKRNNESLQKMLSREKELDTLIESLFEEKVLGNLTDERFKKLTYKYEDEQLQLKQSIKNIKKTVLEDQKHELDVDGFLQIVKKYSDVEKLSIEILNEFIDKIVVHHREELDGMTTQKVEIYYKMIGCIQVPNLSKKEENQYIKYFGRIKKEKIAS